MVEGNKRPFIRLKLDNLTWYKLRNITLWNDYAHHMNNALGLDNTYTESLYSPEVLNGLKLFGIPNHKLVLKVGASVMLIQNNDHMAGLCNGTRLRILKLGEHVIEAQIITGVCFVITINKSKEVSAQDYGFYGFGFCIPNGKWSCDKQFVLMSHGDEEVMVSNGFKVVAKSEQGTVVAVEYDGRWFYGLQYKALLVLLTPFS
ncbi:ATP-dependent DNA helicase PIF1-like protein [Tanacetum coccineum]|uniref:ATP-dependent DNA helicase PIF1-like protein n=1 Tax=Tanacetum coccineum TaxID=301880 RepID=A0ABQ5DWW4_9ASTR